MLKKVISLITCTALVACLVSCDTDSGDTDSDKISVVTTIFPQYDFVRQIAGENVQITMLLKPGSESHTYEPTPQDIVKINECDLFIYNGGEGDVWVDSILESADNSVNTLAMMDCVETVEEKIVEGMYGARPDIAPTIEERYRKVLYNFNK